AGWIFGAGASTIAMGTSALARSAFARTLPGSKAKIRRSMVSATFRYLCGLSFHGESSMSTRAFSRSRSKLGKNVDVACSSLVIFFSLPASCRCYLGRHGVRYGSQLSLLIAVAAQASSGQSVARLEHFLVNLRGRKHS